MIVRIETLGQINYISLNHVVLLNHDELDDTYSIELSNAHIIAIAKEEYDLVLNLLAQQDLNDKKIIQNIKEILSQNEDLAQTVMDDEEICSLDYS